MSMRSHLVTALGLGTALAGLPLAGTPAAAAPDGAGLVISEVYGGGGNSGGAYRSDFIELHNPTDDEIALDGLTVQYRSVAGNVGGQAALSGAVPAGAHHLIKANDGNDTDQPALPEPDATIGASMSTRGGQVLLIDGSSYTGSGDVAGAAELVDMVGWRSTSNTYETAPGPATSNPVSVHRDAAGTDTDDNSADLTTAPPTPAAAGGGDDGDPGSEEPAEVTIAEIQGTGAASPMRGERATTRGVVTALYPGRFNGFYLQTAGTGAGADTTPDASDAVFVYGRDVDLDALDLDDAVEVTGPVSEYRGSTQITADTVTPATEPLPPVTPRAMPYPTTDADRETHEGELLVPTDDLTVTNVYPTNQYGEIGLATGDRPLLQPTEVARPGTAAYDAVVADNAARGVVLDDATSIDFLNYGGPEQDIPLPWLSPENPVRVGAGAELVAPVVLEERFGDWRFQPQRRVTGEGRDVARFENTRLQNRAPADVGGDLSVATFNVLNYFNTTGEEFEAAGGECSYYTDRDGNRIATNRCSNPDGTGGPRGAADEENLARQEEKIVAALNRLGADVVAVEELENSIRLVGETDRDDALASLTRALNRAAGAGTWAYVSSPRAASAPGHAAEQDVIRNGFLYKPATVRPVGRSELLLGDAVFANAREPLAQKFRATGVRDATPFTVIVNHLKSKGCGGASGDNADAGDGQGCYNGDRQRQAMALANFAAGLAGPDGTDPVLIVGDLNSYTAEDPMQVLRGEGYEVVESDQPGDWTYSFDGRSGSLDHVLANEAAGELVTGADVWEINANEAIAFQYSRYNYNATNFHQPGPFAASDHNPEIVGLRAR